MQRVWSHASISRQRKLDVYNACVVCKLTYNLHSVWLTQPEIQKLNAFHMRCLRRILKIAPSFYSRISNQTVLTQARSRRISSVLLERQLKFFGTLARRRDDDVMKQSVLDVTASVLKPKTATGIKRCGRHKISWPKGVYHAAASVASETGRTLSSMLLNKIAWEQAVHKHCRD